MTDKRRGLGRGLGALIPQAPSRVDADSPRPREHGAPTPVDVFFPDRGGRRQPEADDERQNGDVDGHADNDVDRSQALPPRADGSGSTEADAEAGQGLAPAEEVTAVPAAAYFAELPLSEVVPNARQPRQVFDEAAMTELVDSVKEVGLLQPVVVRPLADGRYELVMGERRWRATQAAGLDLIPAIVRQTDDQDMLRDALLENLHRSELNPLEEAAAYDQLLQDFGCTHDELATRIGRSRPQISNTLRLLRLSPAVQRRVAAGVLSAGHARALLGLSDAEAQERLAHRIVAEGLSVRSVEEIVAVGLDDVPRATPARRAPMPTAPGLDDIASRLSDRFETRVKVQLGRRRGKIVVEFASLADLERIIGVFAPEDADSGGLPRTD